MTTRSCTGFVPGTITAAVSAGQRLRGVYMSRLEMKRAWGNAELRESGDTTSDQAERGVPGCTGDGGGRRWFVPDLYPTKITEGQTMPTNTTHHLTVERLTSALAEVSEILVVGTYGQGYRVEVKYDAFTQVWNVYDHGEVTTALTPERAVELFNAAKPRPEAVER